MYSPTIIPSEFTIFEISPEAKTHIKDYVANWLSLTEEFDLPSVKTLPFLF